MKYQKLRIWKETNKELKIMAANKGVTVIKLIDNLVKAEKEKGNEKIS